VVVIPGSSLPRSRWRLDRWRGRRCGSLPAALDGSACCVGRRYRRHAGAAGRRPL